MQKFSVIGRSGALLRYGVEAVDADSALAKSGRGINSSDGPFTARPETPRETSMREAEERRRRFNAPTRPVYTGD